MVKVIHFIGLCDLNDLDKRFHKFFPTLYEWLLIMWTKYPSESLDATEVFIKCCELEDRRLESQMRSRTKEVVTLFLELLTKKEILVCKEDVLALAVYDALAIFLTIGDISQAQKIILPYLGNWTKEDVGIRTSVAYALSALCRLGLPNVHHVALKAVPMFIAVCRKDSESPELKIVVYRCIHWIINAYPTLILEDPDYVILKTALATYEKGGEEGSGAGNTIQGYINWEAPFPEHEDERFQDYDLNDLPIKPYDMYDMIWNVLLKQYFAIKSYDKDELFANWTSTLLMQLIVTRQEEQIEDLPEKWCMEFMEIIYKDFPKGFPNEVSKVYSNTISGMCLNFDGMDLPKLDKWLVDNLTQLGDQSDDTPFDDQFLKCLFDVTASRPDPNLQKVCFRQLLPLVLVALKNEKCLSDACAVILVFATDTTIPEASQVVVDNFQVYWKAIVAFLVNPSFSIGQKGVLLEALINLMAFQTSYVTDSVTTIGAIFDELIVLVESNVKDPTAETIHGFLCEGYCAIVQNLVPILGASSNLFLIPSIMKCINLSQHVSWGAEDQILMDIVGLIFDILNAYQPHEVLSQLVDGDITLLKNILDVAETVDESEEEAHPNLDNIDACRPLLKKITDLDPNKK
jgi:hypothetical protein